MDRILHETPVPPEPTPEGPGDPIEDPQPDEPSGEASEDDADFFVRDGRPTTDTEAHSEHAEIHADDSEDDPDAQ